MNLYAGFARIEEKIVPYLNTALLQVRAKKEEIMSEEWGCPISGCEHTGKTRRGINIHITTIHKLPMSSPGRPEPVNLSGGEPEPEPVATSEPESVSPPSGFVETTGGVFVPVKQEVPEVKAEVSEEVATPEVVQGPPAVAPPLIQPEVFVPKVEPEMPVEVTPEAVSEPPEVKPPPPVKVSKSPVVSVPIGSALLLDGPTWWQHPGTGAWESSVAAKLPVQVVQKEVSSAGDVMLICCAEGGTALWSVQEKQVIAGTVKLLRAAPVAKAVESEATRPADGPREVQKPKYDYFAEQKKEQEERAEQEVERREYGEKLGRFTDAKRRQSNANKEFNQVKQEEYDNLIAYVNKYGKPSEAGKTDLQVIDFDYQARITSTPGGSGIRRKAEIIVQWLLDNDMKDCLVDSLNIPAWEKAKKEGRVPADFVREVEEPYQNASTFKFFTTPV